MSEKVSKKRKLISGANAVVVIIATIGIAIALNAISSQVFARADMTANNIYTLSDASKKAVHDLSEPVHVKAFISPDLPAPLQNLSQAVADTLDEYAAASGGKLTYEIISPSDDAKIEDDAKSVGCKKVAVGQHSKDEVSVRAVYKCVAFTQGDNLEVVKNLKASPNGSLAAFEYDFTKALLNLEKPDPRKVGFVAGFGGPASSPQFVGQVQQVFSQMYGKLIQATTVDLSGDKPTIPDDVHALVILNPEQKFSDEAIFAVDQFIQRGGSVGWYQSATGVNRRLQQQMMRQMPGRRPPDIRTKLDPGLSKVFKAYGLDLRQDMVLDPDKGVTSLAVTQQGLAQLTEPATFLMQDIDQTLPFTRNMTALAIPAPATIQVQSWTKENDDIKVHKIVQTDDTALRRPNPPTSFDYETLSKRDPSEEQGKWTVAAAVEGDVPSYYDKNPLPKGHKESELAKQAAPARVLVVGSGDFFQPMRSVGYNEKLASLGGQFLVSSIEWLVQDTALTQIRSKSMPRLLGDVPTETKHALQFVNIAAVPACFALIGVFMMMRRRRRKESLERKDS